MKKLELFFGLIIRKEDMIGIEERIHKAKNSFVKYKEHPFREHQYEAILRAYQSEKPIVVIHAPPGAGKSLIGMTLARLYKKATYLVSSKPLQQQLRGDFPEARLLMGRNNYTCNKLSMVSADLCTSTPSNVCNLKSKCQYEIAKLNALEAQFPILNYHYFLHEANYVGKFSNKNPVVICDEAHSIESLLLSFVNLFLSSTLTRSLNIPKPKYKTSTAKGKGGYTGLESWKSWAKDAKRMVQYKLNDVKSCYIGNISDEGGNWELDKIKKKKQLNGLVSKIDLFSKIVTDDWLFKDDKGYMFEPTWLTPEITNQYLWRHGEKFILLSATFPPMQMLAHLLGLGLNDIEYIPVPSTFPAENRPIILSPAGDLSHKCFNDNIQGVVEKVKEIINLYPNDKGVIHTISYKLNAHIMNIRDPRLITHDSKNKQDVLNMFINSPKPFILVSPSSEQGLDLYDDRARFQIIAKAPFLSLASKQVSARVFKNKLGNYWYKSAAAQSIIQMAGRAVRHKDDWCDTWIIDDKGVELVVDNAGMYPGYWREAIQYR